jgi:prepilin-type N-terminal cleavage/methylation domain-containing protein
VAARLTVDAMSSLRTPNGRSARAFTLTELVVVIVIVGLLAATATVTYNAIVERTEEEAAQLTLQSVLREAAALAGFDNAGSLTSGHVAAAVGDLPGAASAGVHAATDWDLVEEPNGVSSTYGTIVAAYHADGRATLGMVAPNGRCVWARGGPDGGAAAWKSRSIPSVCQLADDPSLTDPAAAPADWTEVTTDTPWSHPVAGGTAPGGSDGPSEGAQTPGAPTIDWSDAYDLGIDVGWIAPADTGDAPITGYAVTISGSGYDESFTTPSTGANHLWFSAWDAGVEFGDESLEPDPYNYFDSATPLQLDTTYTVTIRAINAHGQGAPLVLLLTPTPPPAPGELIATDTFDDAGTGSVAVSAVDMNSFGQLVVAGRFTGTLTLGGHSVSSPSGSDWDSFVGLYDNGTWRWLASAGGTDNGGHIDQINAVAATTSAVYVTGGYVNTPDGFLSGKPASQNSTQDAYVAALDAATGEVLWSDTSGTPNSMDFGTDVDESNGTVFVAAAVSGTYGGTPVGFATEASGVAASDATTVIAAFDAETGGIGWAVNGNKGFGNVVLDADWQHVYVAGMYSNEQTLTGTFADLDGTGGNVFVTALGFGDGQIDWMRWGGAAGFVGPTISDIYAHQWDSDVYLVGHINPVYNGLGFLTVPDNVGNFIPFVLHMSGDSGDVYAAQSSGTAGGYGLAAKVGGNDNGIYVTGGYFTYATPTSFLAPLGYSGGIDGENVSWVGRIDVAAGTADVMERLPGDGYLAVSSDELAVVSSAGGTISISRFGA